MKSVDQYALSEKIRLSCQFLTSQRLKMEYLIHSIHNYCPWTFPLWADLITAFGESKREFFRDTESMKALNQWAEEVLFKKYPIDDADKNLVLNEEVIIKASVMEDLANLRMTKKRIRGSARTMKVFHFLFHANWHKSHLVFVGRAWSERAAFYIVRYN